MAGPPCEAINVFVAFSERAQQHQRNQSHSLNERLTTRRYRGPEFAERP